MGEDSWLEVPLGCNGLRALVSACDYELVSQYRWSASHRPRGVIYARRRWQENGHERAQYMHSLITGWPLVDHRNHDGLDNRRQNLRPADHTQNLGNQRAQTGKSSRFKGVYWDKSNNRWRVYIRARRRPCYLGLYLDEVRAAQAYDAAARIAYGEFACLNFPEVADVRWDDRFRQRLSRLPRVTD